MTTSSEALRELHRIHRQAADLKERLARGPKQVRICQLTVQRGEKDVADAKDLLKKTRLESDEQQLQLRQREAKIQDLQRKLNECKTNVEFKALKDQIAAEKQANSVLEDEIFDKLEKIDQGQHHVAEANAKLARANEELHKAQQRVADEQNSLQTELDRVAAALKTAEVVLPDTFKAEYDRMVRAKGEGALAAVEGESCGSCNTVLTTQVIHQLHLSVPVFCKNCGSLLYLVEGHCLPEN